MSVILRNYVNNRNNETELVSILKNTLLLVNEKDELCDAYELFLSNPTLRLFYKDEFFIKESYYKDIIEQYGYDTFISFIKALEGVNSSSPIILL